MATPSRSRTAMFAGSTLVWPTAQRAMHVGSVVMRFGLVFILVVIGFLKFTTAEAMAIQPLVTHSPLFAWMNGVFGVQGTSNFFGAFEIVTGLLTASRLISPRLSALGSAMAIVIFLGTVSFLFSTPGFSPGSMVDEFLFKDITLLGASIWACGEALFAVQPFAPPVAASATMGQGT